MAETMRDAATLMATDVCAPAERDAFAAFVPA
jgi:hypothetical protein